MAPKSSQPFLLQIHKERVFGISSAFWDIWVRSSEKSIFGYSLTFHNGGCTKNMNFQKVIFYSAQITEFWDLVRFSCKLVSNLGSRTLVISLTGSRNCFAYMDCLITFFDCFTLH